MPAMSGPLMMASAPAPAAPRRGRRKPFLRADQDVARQALVERQRLPLLDRLLGLALAKVGRESGDRVLATPPDEVSASFRSSFRDLGVALELLRVDDRHVEAGLHAVVEEDRVQHLAPGRRQAERHVGNAEDGLAARQLLLDEPDALDRLDAGADVVLVAGPDAEHERVEDDVLGVDAVLLVRICASARRSRASLARDRLRLSLVLVDAADDERAPKVRASGTTCESAPRRPPG
jgi:hypothetical protein